MRFNNMAFHYDFLNRLKTMVFEKDTDGLNRMKDEIRAIYQGFIPSVVRKTSEEYGKDYKKSFYNSLKSMVDIISAISALVSRMAVTDSSTESKFDLNRTVTTGISDIIGDSMSEVKVNPNNIELTRDERNVICRELNGLKTVMSNILNGVNNDE